MRLPPLPPVPRDQVSRRSRVGRTLCTLHRLTQQRVIVFEESQIARTPAGFGKYLFGVVGLADLPDNHEWKFAADRCPDQVELVLSRPSMLATLRINGPSISNIFRNGIGSCGAAKWGSTPFITGMNCSRERPMNFASTSASACEFGTTNVRKRELGTDFIDGIEMLRRLINPQRGCDHERQPTLSHVIAEME